MIEFGVYKTIFLKKYIMKKQIPPKVKEIIVKEAEHLIFPKPAKTRFGKINRFVFKIAKIIFSNSK